MGQEPTPPATGQEPDGGTQPAPDAGDGKQEPKVFDEAYVKELRSENAKHRREASDLRDRLQALEDRDKSDTEKVTGERDRLKAEVDPLKGENLRLRVAIDKKLPAELIDRLRGDTREDLEQDADKLLELVKPAAQPTPTAPDFDGGVRPPITPPSSAEDQHQAFLADLLSGRPPAT